MAQGIVCLTGWVGPPRLFSDPAKRITLDIFLGQIIPVRGKKIDNKHGDWGGIDVLVPDADHDMPHPVWVWFPQVSIPATVIKSSLAQTGVLEGERGSYEQLYWFYANWDVRSQASLGLGTHWLEKPRNVKRGFSELRVAVPTLS